MKNCQQCGMPFEAKSRIQKYCDKRCYNRAKGKRANDAAKAKGYPHQKPQTSEYQRWNLIWVRYRMRQADWEKMFQDQSERCVFGCTEPGAGGWVVDHDHRCCDGRKSCGKCVRGILCQPHNKAMHYVDRFADQMGDMLKYSRG